MKLAQFDRVVIMAGDVRYPEFSAATAQLLRAHGAREPQAFLNGRGQPGLDPARYDLVQKGEPPPTWTHAPVLWDYWQAYRAVVSAALADGVEHLLVCEDDIEISPNFAAVAARAQVPADWEILYFGAMHYWAPTPAAKVAPYVVRLNGAQLGIQAVGYRRAAMMAFLDLVVDRSIDHALAGLHRTLPTYCFEPSIIRQQQGVTSVIVPGEPFAAAFVYDLPTS